MAITEEELERILSSIDFKNLTPEQITGENGLLKLFTKKFIEKTMGSEMDQHLGYHKHHPAGRNSGNSRNGKSKKHILTDQGKVEIDVPRDRNGEFEPQIVKKHQRRFEGFDDKIISMYSRGMTTRDIQEHVKDIYGVEVRDIIKSCG